MERIERFFRIRNLLRNKNYVNRDEFLAELEVSAATFKRDLEYLRDRLQLPIEWIAEKQAYTLVESATEPDRFELPGLWFNSVELQALITVEHLVSGLGPGLLSEVLGPFRQRIHRLVSTGDHTLAEMGRRIKIQSVAARFVPPRYFQLVASGTLERRRLRLTYFARGAGRSTERVVSPQRLVHYRDNWYLEAWCHLRNSLRVFALDSFEQAALLDEKAKDIPESQLDEQLSESYGIFAGKPTHVAVLRFSAERARWVAREQWHPQQKGRKEADGSFTLEVPYSDDRELLMDVLRHGSEVRVLGPESLRHRLLTELDRIRAAYAPSGGVP
jgi:predicted DNA-binding transcriptional regulator YafY